MQFGRRGKCRDWRVWKGRGTGVVDQAKELWMVRRGRGRSCAGQLVYVSMSAKMEKKRRKGFTRDKALQSGVVPPPVVLALDVSRCCQVSSNSRPLD